MKLLWESRNGWGIGEQADLLGSTIYCIYRYYPNVGFIPFKSMGSILSLCFLWLYRGKFISYDEMVTQCNKFFGKENESTPVQ